MDYKLIAFIVTTLIALSGWGTLLYNWFTSSPKIDGKILGLITAVMMHPQFDKPKTIIFPYLYLVNRRKNPVHILDYELYFDIGHGYERALRIYGTKNFPEPDFSGKDSDVKIDDFLDKVIYSKKSPLTYGSPQHGFALFATDEPRENIEGKINKVKIKCIDVFNNSHEIFYDKSQKSNLYLLQDIADIHIKKKKTN
jgi:hypothetical protein